MDLSKLLPPEVQAGMSLSADEVHVLEAQLSTTPDDALLHQRLLGYYANAMLASPDAGAKAEPHQLWLIEHAPQSSAAASPFIVPTTLQGQTRADRLWREAIRAHPGDPRVIANAAYFYEQFHPAQSAQLLQIAQQLDPSGAWKRPDLASMVSELQTRMDSELAQSDARAAAQRPDGAIDPALAAFRALNGQARKALEAGDADQARAHAEELLAQAPRFDSDWSHGNAVHEAHTVLGRLALKQGDLASARTHLLESAEVRGSPQLDSFGPSMALAQALLELGENDVVLQFLERCRAFWKMGGGLLDAWIRDVQAGQAPQFRGNVLY